MFVDEVGVVVVDLMCVVIDVCDGVCYCGESDLFDFNFGYVFGVINVLFVMNFGFDGWFFDCDVFVVWYCLLIGDCDVIVYCGLGVIVCYMLFVIECVGFVMLKFYVGLWSEWGWSGCLIVIGKELW